LADLARRWYGGRAGDVAGFVAGWLLLADPQVAAFAHYLWPEVLHLVLFLAAVRTLAWVEERSSGGPGAGEGEDGAKAAPFAKVALGLAAASLALGLALQAKSLLLPFLPLLLLPVLRGGARRAAVRIAVVLAVIAATSAPALVANHRAGYGWTLPDSSRFNLWVGLNDTSRRNLVGEIVGTEYERYRASAPALPERNAILGGKISALAAREGIGRLAARQLARQPFRLFDRESFLTDQLPGGAIVAQGYGYSSVPIPAAAGLRVWGTAVYAALLFLALVGLARGRAAWSPRGARWRPVWLAFLAYNLLLFLALHVKTRYRIQMLPALDLFAAFGCAGLWEGVRLSKRARWSVAL